MNTILRRLLSVSCALVLILAAAAAPAGENCSDVTPIPHGDFSFSGDTRVMADDFSYGVFGIDSPDAAYCFSLPDGEHFSCDLATTADLVLYFFFDCADPTESGFYLSDDDPEYFYYTNDTGGTLNFYMVVDGLADNEVYCEGEYVLTGTNGGTVPIDDLGWDGVKALYR